MSAPQPAVLSAFGHGHTFLCFILYVVFMLILPFYVTQMLTQMLNQCRQPRHNPIT